MNDLTHLLNTVFPVTIDGHRSIACMNRIVVEPVYGTPEEARDFTTWSEALDHIDRRNGNIPAGEK